MNKKNILYAIVLSALFIQITSCKSYQNIKASQDLPLQVQALERGDQVMVAHQDGSLYLLDFEQLMDGKLMGMGFQKTQNRIKAEPKLMQFELDEIQAIKVKRTSAVQSFILAGGIALAAVGVFALGSLAGWF
ncbi:hypothetical protein [Pararhodonellum marinum]|uniref:hypothetical protein n=1 Tax=Pararhodonellum marinum TaxID=2755358 RepID=UPI00188E20D5|nr:hypothetical protein [Pararhodonellum marinum]